MLVKFFCLFKKKIFEGLAQETLIMCIQSLLKASEMIKKNKVSCKIGFSSKKKFKKSIEVSYRKVLIELKASLNFKIKGITTKF